MHGTTLAKRPFFSLTCRVTLSVGVHPLGRGRWLGGPSPSARCPASRPTWAWKVAGHLGGTVRAVCII